MTSMNTYAVRSIYLFEMARWFRTVVQSILSPVISTSLYFVVFGAAIGARMSQIDGVALVRVDMHLELGTGRLAHQQVLQHGGKQRCARQVLPEERR